MIIRLVEMHEGDTPIHQRWTSDIIRHHQTLKTRRVTAPTDRRVSSFHISPRSALKERPRVLAADPLATTELLKRIARRDLSHWPGKCSCDQWLAAKMICTSGIQFGHIGMSKKPSFPLKTQECQRMPTRSKKIQKAKAANESDRAPVHVSKFFGPRQSSKS